jgi:hypothetical protein
VISLRCREKSRETKKSDRDGLPRDYRVFARKHPADESGAVRREFVRSADCRDEEDDDGAIAASHGLQLLAWIERRHSCDDGISAFIPRVQHRGGLKRHLVGIL